MVTIRQYRSLTDMNVIDSVSAMNMRRKMLLFKVLAFTTNRFLFSFGAIIQVNLC